MNCYCFVVGIIDPFMDNESAERAIAFIKSLPGMIAVHPDVTYTILIFDTLDHARTSRGMWTEAGQKAGPVMRGRIEEDGQTITVIEPADNMNGGRVQ